MELCLLHTQKKKIVAHSKKKIVEKKKEKICSKVLTLKTASGHPKKKSPRPGIEPGASA